MNEIDAGRLVLRPVGRDEARALLAGHVPAGLVFAPGYPSEFSLEAMELVAGTRSAESDGIGEFFIVRKADGAVIEEIGGRLDAGSGTVEVGYTLVEPSWGRGYATEALRALLVRLRADPRVRRIVAEAPVGHTASRRVMEKAGMRLHDTRMGEEKGRIVELAVYEAGI